MKVTKYICLFACLIIIGCASLPPEAVISQKKVSEGVNTARTNQILLINNFAEEAKAKLQLSYRLAIPAALKDDFGEKDNYTREEIIKALVDYGEQLQGDLRVIDDKRNELIQETNIFFNELSLLSNINLELLESVVKLNEKYKSIYNEILSKNDKIKEILGRE